MLASADDNIRLDTHALQVLYACLGGLRLQLLGAFQVRNQSNVYQNSVLMAHLVLKLTDGFQKGLTFNIANGSPYLNDGDAGVRVGKVAVKAAFDFIGDVGNHLNGASAVVASAFLLQNGPIYLSCGHIGVFVQAFINESLVMSQIQVCFRSVISDEYLPVLNGIHGARIDIDIRVKFLHGDLIAPGLQKPSQGCGCDTLAQT